MPEMTSRERLLKALNHEEPDRVPYDLASTHVTGISWGAYKNLREHLGLPEREPLWLDVVQQVVVPHSDVMDRLDVDTRGVYPLTSHNWDVFEQLEDAGDHYVYHDEWGLTQHFPKEDQNWFSVVGHPLQDVEPTIEAVESHSWPEAGDKRRVEGLREKATAYHRAGYPVVVKGICAGIFEMMQRLRGMENALMDPMMHPEFSDALLGKLTDIKIEFWQMALHELGDVVDVVVENDDYGTQQSQLISHEQYQQLMKPHQMRLFAAIKEAAPNVFIFYHSCGNVRPFLPDFIEAGMDILNPVHVSASGMEPHALKRDFGEAVTFWGGGVETQHVLPNGSPDEVREDVKRNVEALAPGGGFVFNTVHNIQSDAPPENIMAMWEALMEFGRY
jgi:uroporphyrinogen decarboxylase